MPESPLAPIPTQSQTPVPEAVPEPVPEPVPVAGPAPESPLAPVPIPAPPPTPGPIPGAAGGDTPVPFAPRTQLVTPDRAGAAAKEALDKAGVRYDGLAALEAGMSIQNFMLAPYRPHPEFTPTPGFDFEEHLTPEDDPVNFALARSFPEVAYIRLGVAEERKRRQAMEYGPTGVGLVGELLGVVTNPALALGVVGEAAFIGTAVRTTARMAATRTVAETIKTASTAGRVSAQAKTAATEAYGVAVGARAAATKAQAAVDDIVEAEIAAGRAGPSLGSKFDLKTAVAEAAKAEKAAVAREAELVTAQARLAEAVEANATATAAAKAALTKAETASAASVEAEGGITTALRADESLAARGTGGYAGASAQWLRKTMGAGVSLVPAAVRGKALVEVVTKAETARVAARAAVVADEAAAVRVAETASAAVRANAPRAERAVIAKKKAAAGAKVAASGQRAIATETKAAVEARAAATTKAAAETKAAADAEAAAAEAVAAKAVTAADVVKATAAADKAYSEAIVAGAVGTGMTWAQTLAIVGAEVASEVQLQKQYERSRLETTINITAVGVLGVVLGRAAGGLSKEELKQAANSLAVDMGSSAGAQRAGTTLEQEALVGGKVAEVASMATPRGRLMASPSVESRRIVQELVETPEATRGQAEGITAGTPLESEIRQGVDGVLGQRSIESTRLFKQYRKRGGKLSRVEFDEAATIAGRNFDSHDIPEVAEMARWDTENIYKPGRQAAIDAGLLKRESLQEIPGGSYRPRVWKGSKIAHLIPELRQAFRRYFEGEYAKAGKAVDPDDMDELVGRTLENVEGGNYSGLIPSTVTPTSGAFKGRVLHIPETQLVEYLDNSSSAGAAGYLKSTVPEIVFARSTDTTTLGAAIKNIEARVIEGYAPLINRATGDARIKLQDSLRKDLRDIGMLIERLRGIAGRPRYPGGVAATASGFMRTANVATMLGGATLSSIPDMARPIMQYGLKQFAKGIWARTTQFVRSAKSKAELQTWGAALDTVRGGQRIEKLMDVQDVGGKLGVVTRTSLLWSGLLHWSEGIQAFAGAVGADTIASWTRTLARGEKLSKVRTSKLARIGIDVDWAKRIDAQMEIHADTNGTLLIPNTGAWTDLEAARKFGLGWANDVRMVSLEPTAGDLPLFFSSEFGAVVMQFKSFMMSAHAKILVAGIQRADADFAVGVLAMITMGAMATGAKDWLRGKDPLDRSWDSLIVNALERSGAGGILGMPIATLHDLFSGEKTSRAAGFNLAGQFLGPTPGALQSMGAVGASALEGEWNSRNIMRLTPWVNNMWHLRQILEQADVIPSSTRKN